MMCREREALHQQWVAEHDGLCVALEEYERRLSTVSLEEFERLKLTLRTARLYCDLAKELLDRHERTHGCAKEQRVFGDAA